MKDSAEFMEFINKHIYRYEHGIELASLLYNLAHNKEDIAYKIVQLHDLVFESLSNTPDMDGSLLLDAKGLAALKESRKKWIELSGKHKHKISNDLKKYTKQWMLNTYYHNICWTHNSIDIYPILSKTKHNSSSNKHLQYTIILSPRVILMI